MEIFRTFGTIMLSGAKDTEQALDTIDNKAEKTGMSMGELGKSAIKAGAVIGTALVAAGSAVVGLAVKTAASMDKIDKESQKMGMTAKAYQEWDFILSQNGASVDSLGRGVTSMTRLMDEAAQGTDKAVGTFNKLGLELDSLDGLTREEMFEETIKALQAVESETERATLANEVFGGGVARELMPLLNAGADSVDNLKDKAADLGLIMSDDMVKGGADFMDTLDQLKRSAMATLFTALEPFIPVIKELMQNLLAVIPPLLGFIAPLVEKLMPVVKTIIEQLLPIFLRLLNSIVPILEPLITVVLMLAERALFPLINLFARLIDKLLPPLLSLFDVFAIMLEPIIFLFEGIMQALEPLIDEVLDLLIDTILPLLIEYWEMLGEEILPMVVDLLLELIQALLPLLPPLIDLIATIMPVFMKIFSEVIKFILPMLIKLIQFLIPVIEFVVKGFTLLVDAVIGFINATVKAFPEFLKKVKELPQKIIGFFKGLPKQMMETGKNIVMGIWDGIKNMSKWLGEKLTGFAKKIIPAPIAKALGINSPSKLFAGFGANLSEGLAFGMEKTKNLVEDASDSLAQAASFGANVKPAFATATTQQIYQSARNISVPVILNGREIARASARDMDEELADLAKR